MTGRITVWLLEKMLTSQGYTSVMSVTDSRDAVENYQTYKPDIVILDINMPYLDGYQVMERLKQIEEDSYIPVLIITAQHDEETKLLALKSGAKDFLTKPFSKLETLSRIKNLIEVRILHSKPSWRGSTPE